MKIKIEKLSQFAVTPSYATPGSACFDLHLASAFSGIAVVAGHARELNTHLAFEIPAGHVMLVFSRSGHAFNGDLRLSNCVGVIDSDYRGEVLVKMRNDGEDTKFFRPGDRIAQALVIPVQQVTFDEVDALSASSRGTGGFGSTGE